MGEMRDRRKTAAYFEAYIACEKGRLEKKLEKVNACTDREQAARVWNSIFLYRMNLLLASFSAGADRDELKELYEAACEAACRISSLSYGDALVLSCFSVMLGSFSAMKPVAGLFESVFTMDKLLGGLRSYPESGHAVWQGEYRFPEVYGALDAVLEAGTKEAGEKALLSWMETWYDKCGDCAWHGTLESANDVYYGYWCLEAAALAIIFGFDTERLSGNEYFPAV